MIWIWLLAFLALVIAVPLIVEAKRNAMDKTARATAPGSFVRLPQGLTHFQWKGPADGQVIVCVHGLTTPSFVWQSVASRLADQGFRVLTYDLYGRGYSDRPGGVQNPEFFLQQLNSLLESQNINSRVTIIGYSMGGAVAAAFAASNPKRTDRTILLAPAGMHPVGSGLIRFMAQSAIIGYWLMLALYPAILRRGHRAEADLPTSVPDIVVKQGQELNYRRFIAAVHASLRGMLTHDFQIEHETVKRAGVPVLAIWGAEDDVIPLSAKDKLSTWNPDVQHHVVAGAGHGLTYTHTQNVMVRIEAFLASPT